MKHEFKIHKPQIDHTFTITVIDEGQKFDVLVDGKNDALISKITDHNENIITFWPSKKFGNQKINGITITDEIKQTILAASERYYKYWVEEKINREKDRPAPYLDTEKYFIFSLGCDTGNVYPESHRKAVNAILRENLIKPEEVFCGERDNTCKYEGIYDSYIPSYYVKKIKTGELNFDKTEEKIRYEAKGYKSIWCEDTFALPKKLVDEYQEKINNAIKAEKERKIKEEQERIQKIKDLAKETNTKQVLNQYSDYCNDPDEECNIDNIVEYVMPDGTISVERDHTW